MVGRSRDRNTEAGKLARRRGVGAEAEAEDVWLSSWPGSEACIITYLVYA